MRTRANSSHPGNRSDGMRACHRPPPPLPAGAPTRPGPQIARLHDPLNQDGAAPLKLRPARAEAAALSAWQSGGAASGGAETPSQKAASAAPCECDDDTRDRLGGPGGKRGRGRPRLGGIGIVLGQGCRKGGRQTGGLARLGTLPPASLSQRHDTMERREGPGRRRGSQPPPPGRTQNAAAGQNLRGAPRAARGAQGRHGARAPGRARPCSRRAGRKGGRLAASLGGWGLVFFSQSVFFVPGILPSFFVGTASGRGPPPPGRRPGRGGSAPRVGAPGAGPRPAAESRACGQGSVLQAREGAASRLPRARHGPSSREYARKAA
jgi:hypothetical protein